MTRRQLELDISRQPDGTTCGPTCLHAVYRFFGEDVALGELIDEVPHLEEGGTLAVLLACHAMKRGYRAILYSYNLRMFDPSWFDLDRKSLALRLAEQSRVKGERKLDRATQAYVELLELGGELRFADLSPRLVHRLLDDDLPLLAGLSASYLYRCPREVAATDEPDDIRGEPVGHFVVLHGYDERRRRVDVADPLHPNPLGDTGFYSVGVDRLITSILLGVLTYDGNLLQLQPGHRGPKKETS